MSPIQAITFDLWDTVILDDSDEPRRAALGLPPKREQRRILVHRALEAHDPVSRELVDTAYEAVDAAFRQVWYGQHVTWTVAERLAVLLKGLKRELPPATFDELTRAHEEMELEVRPDPVAGVQEAVRALTGRYRLGVISDAIFSPGRALREILRGYGILDCFEYFVFSDEIGRAKPEPVLFERAAEGLGVPLEALLHIGDRVEKDVDGAHAAGARAILFVGAVDRGGPRDRADAVCADYRELPALLDELARAGTSTSR